MRTRRHITRRLVPFLFVLYVLNYLDRVNISYAALQMTGDLGFSNTVFGFGAGIFFIGYFLLQIPVDARSIELWSARKFIALSLIVWGALAALSGFVSTRAAVLLDPFFLGAAEAGFFPGVIVYLTHWYRYEDRGKAVAMFMMAIPMSNMVGAVIAAFLMRIDWLGYDGWRWLLILEGLPAVVAGIVAFFYLTDRPKDAAGCPTTNGSGLPASCERERETKKARQTLSAWQALRHPQVILLALGVLLLHHQQRRPRRLAAEDRAAHLRTEHDPGDSDLGHSVAGGDSGDAPGRVALGQDRRAAMARGNADPARRRRAGAEHRAGNNLVLAIAAFSLATMALYSFPSPFWALPTIFLSGTAAAASIALINSIGNLGGFVGPYVIGFLTDGPATTRRESTIWCRGVFGGLLLLSLRPEQPAMRSRA